MPEEEIAALIQQDNLVRGHIYTRYQLRAMFSIEDKTLETGVYQPKGQNTIWLFVTERKKASLPPLNDSLVGNLLYWDGQPEGRTDKYIINHEKDGKTVQVFYRKSHNQFPDYGFCYLGYYHYMSHIGSKPAHFVLEQIDEFYQHAESDIRAARIEESRQEGLPRQILTNHYERDAKLRASAIRIHGTKCQACGFSFEAVYGEHGKDYIEVHHKKPISTYTLGEVTNPQTDMAVLCANCHRMIHRYANSPLTIEALQRMAKRN